MPEENREKNSTDHKAKEVSALKSTKIYDAVIIGFLAGIAIYSTVKNGFGWLTFLPLVYLPIARKNRNKRVEAEKHQQDQTKEP